MTVYRHEMKQNRNMMLIWSISVAALIFFCMIMYPSMQSETENISEMFSSMSGFSEAFGMDKLSFGTAMGFYGIECGNVLGIGGAFFAAYLGIGMLSKEESGHTSEFLFTHGISRIQILLEKLLALLTIMILFHSICIITSVISFAVIGEDVVVKSFVLFHIAQFIMQIELAIICFAISAFMKRGGMGIGLGLAAVLYFVNIISNISNHAEWLKYITPFHYADAASVIADEKLDALLVSLGVIYMLVATGTAFFYYGKKDLAS